MKKVSKKHEKSASNGREPGRKKELTRKEKEMREVTIHVCDENRGIKKDFLCPQKLLLDKMVYFREVTKDQELEEVDISVHCDIKIFDWLMCWVKFDNPKDKPLLEPTNVISILVSASFLKMDELVVVSLDYIYENMNRILAVNTSFSCVGDNLITRLARRYRPSQLENLSDKRDGIHNKLYTKMITFLCSKTASPENGIWCTLNTLFRCQNCGKFLTSANAGQIACLPSSSTIHPQGSIVPKHVRDQSFNVNDFIKSLKMELKSWRKVFWRLWGISHAMLCFLCGKYFQLYMVEFCLYHGGEAEYPAMAFKNATYPIGEYPCCSKPAAKFLPLNTGWGGCRYRDHKVKIANQVEADIYSTLLTHRDLICLTPARKATLIKIVADATSVCLPRSPSSKDHFSGEVLEAEGDRSVHLPIPRCLSPPPSSTGLIKFARNSRKLNNSRPSLKKAAVSRETSSALEKKPQPGLRYGRIKRAPKLSKKKSAQSTETSSSSSSNDDESSGGEDDHDHDVLGEDEEDNKEVCIQVKLAKEDKPKPDQEKTPVDGMWYIWDSARGTRVNQDYQREVEDMALQEISGQLGKLHTRLEKQLPRRESMLKLVEKPRTESAGKQLSRTDSSLSQVGGSFLRLEQDWRESHTAYLQHRNTTSKMSRPPSSGSSSSKQRLKTPILR